MKISSQNFHRDRRFFLNSKLRKWSICNEKQFLETRNKLNAQWNNLLLKKLWKLDGEQHWHFLIIKNSLERSSQGMILSFKQKLKFIYSDNISLWKHLKKVVVLGSIRSPPGTHWKRSWRIWLIYLYQNIINSYTMRIMRFISNVQNILQWNQKQHIFPQIQLSILVILFDCLKSTCFVVQTVWKDILHFICLTDTSIIQKVS